MEKIEKLKGHTLREILTHAVRKSYKLTLRKVQPQVYVNCADYKVKASKPLDRFFGLHHHRPEYEKGLIQGLENEVEKGDKVVIVGGGQGVTAMKAADLTGDPENVAVYEGSESQVEKMRDSFSKNDYEGFNVINGVVGSEVNVWGETENIDQIDSEDLPECDVLELDCEGSELNILENLEIRPRAILVESHGMNGSSSEEVKSKLENLGYSVENIQPAEPGGFCEKRDIMVLRAVK